MARHKSKIAISVPRASTHARRLQIKVEIELWQHSADRFYETFLIRSGGNFATRR